MRALRRLAGLSLLCAAGASAAEPVTLTSRSAKAMSTQELARALLPEAVQSIEAAEILPPIVSDGALPALRFFARAEIVGRQFCRRAVFYVSLATGDGFTQEALRQDPPVRRRAVIDGVQVALAPGCRMPEGRAFATVQPKSAEASAVALLGWLSALQERARRRGEMVFPVTCRSDFPSQACSGGAAAAFGRLPLHKAYIIEAVGDGERVGWSVAIAPTLPGQLFWDLFVSASAADAGSMTMRWRAPAPF